MQEHFIITLLTGISAILILWNEIFIGLAVIGLLVCYYYFFRTVVIQVKS